MQTRQQKITYLKGLAKGARSLSELEAERVEFFFQKEVDQDAFTTRLETMEKSNGVVTRSQIAEFGKTHPRVKILVMHCAAGCAPLVGIDN